ncbi:hypothetical protein OG792_09195 [Micromonospora sp. NBC_01699]|uniref:hypothetical protein n=1 Tax=Micromonospora sp. NBC_01699 TaxID=2975984 RepID=UPI002E2EB1FB|nr:hypothetical protein [Micromonospora sp. NBC_01699]
MTGRITLGTWLRTGTGILAGTAVSVLMLWRWHDVASVEAWLNAQLVAASGLADARSIGSAVVFPLDHRLVGFGVTAGCSVALLLVPPLVMAAFFLGIRRVSLLRATVSSALAIVLLVLVNQVRLAAVVGSMRIWGFQTGYERSHVLIGSAITTGGLIVIGVLFVVVLTGGRRRGGPAGRRRRGGFTGGRRRRGAIRAA